MVGQRKPKAGYDNDAGEMNHQAVPLLQDTNMLDEIRKVQYDMLVWCNAGAFPINVPDVAAQPTCADAMDEAIGLLNVFDIHLARCKSKTDDRVLLNCAPRFFGRCDGHPSPPFKGQ